MSKLWISPWGVLLFRNGKLLYGTAPCSAIYGTPPAELIVTLSGIVNGGIGDQCANLNGVYYVPISDTTATCCLLTAQYALTFSGWNGYNTIYVTVEWNARNKTRRIEIVVGGVPPAVADFVLTVAYDPDVEIGAISETINNTGGATTICDFSAAIASITS